MFDKLHLTFNFKSEVSRDVFKNNNECQLTCTIFFFLKCCRNVTCLIVCAISIGKVSIDVWFFFLHKSHYMSKSKLCVSIDMHFYSCASICMSNIKNLQKLCQKYTLHGNKPRVTSHLHSTWPCPSHASFTRGWHHVVFYNWFLHSFIKETQPSEVQQNLGLFGFIQVFCIGQKPKTQCIS
jgi:hypothetical protein